MRLAVIQHRLCETAEQDVRSIAAAAAEAASRGADLVVVPELSAIAASPALVSLLDSMLADVPAYCLIPSSSAAAGPDGIVSVPVSADLEGFGSVAVFSGDRCFDLEALQDACSAFPSAALLAPASENDLQAEAVLELAIGLSDSLAGLVIVAECSGAEPGKPGHGGSAIVLLGEVVAEAIGDADVLVADIELPVPQPEPREPIPQIAPILAQRVAHHQGRKAKPPGDYPADLS